MIKWGYASNSCNACTLTALCLLYTLHGWFLIVQVIYSDVIYSDVCSLFYEALESSGEFFCYASSRYKRYKRHEHHVLKRGRDE